MTHFEHFNVFNFMVYLKFASVGFDFGARANFKEYMAENEPLGRPTSGHRAKASPTLRELMSLISSLYCMPIAEGIAILCNRLVH